MRRTRHKSNKKPNNSRPFSKGRVLLDLFILLLLITLVYLGIRKFVDYQLEIGLAGGFVVFAFLLWKILSLYLNANEYSERKDFVDLHAKILGSAALVISLLFTWQGIKNNQKTSEENQRLTLQSLENAERQRIEDRYNKALEQLGSKEREARLGAIYSLGKIAADSIEFSKKNEKSKDFYSEIMQTLCSYIRGNAPITKLATRASEEMPTDIQAALSVLAWRSRKYENGEDQRLQLYGSDLRGAMIKSIEPISGRTEYEGGHFEGAQLYNVNFEKANLRGIKLKDAILANSNFKDAYLVGADLTGADLTGADLTGADLGFVTGLDADQLKQAKNWDKVKSLPPNIRKQIEENPE